MAIETLETGTLKAELPDGTIVFAPDIQRLEPLFEAQGGTAPPVTPYVAPLPTPADVVAERTRRLAAGFDFDFGDARGVHRIGTTDADLSGWREVSDLAGALLAIGHTTSPITIVTDTGPAQVMPGEWQQVLLAAAGFRQPLWGASFVLQSMNPIPADYANDGHWPN